MSIKEHLFKNFGLNLVNKRPLSTGFGVEGLQGRLTNTTGRETYEVAIKSKLGKPSDEFSLEARMLEELKAVGWPVPSVIAYDAQYLIMEWVKTDGKNLSNEGEAAFGAQLAALHNGKLKKNNTPTYYGFPYHTRIGTLKQPNPKTTSWLEFFKNHRLRYMAQRALEHGQLPVTLFNRLETFLEKLGDHLYEPDHPALIHGDLWGGNILSLNGKLSGLIDPAIYNAHFEIELAFTQMFNSLSTAFFEGYQTVQNLDPDFFRERIAIYNLYPTLVHVRLFGAGYLAPIDQTLKRFGH